MTSSAEVTALWSHEVRTSAATVYADGRLLACHSSIRVNDSMRDSSNLFHRDGAPHGYVHPGQVVTTPCTNAWSTARLYYEEPIGQRSIYVESVLRDCDLVRISPGEYRLLLPDRKVNRYIYRDGLLQEVHVDRMFFDLVFRRL